jgi:hypothetical protein
VAHRDVGGRRNAGQCPPWRPPESSAKVGMVTP